MSLVNEIIALTPWDQALPKPGLLDHASAAFVPAGEVALEPTTETGALQGGLIAVLVDVCTGRLAYQSCDHENGFSTATSDLTIHFLSPVVVGPARADAWIVRQGRSNFVLQVEVTDVGRDNKLAAVSTIAFTVLAPQP